ncbi:MAG: prenyltransferase [Anaerolineales bacterium]|nr:prenyltransferase [Anaerolineales bacterium]
MSTLRSAYYFFRLGRPLFLVGGVVFHMLGVSAALYAGHPLNWTALLLGQMAVTCTQLMTHYSNDYFDYEADRANTTATYWSGGSRVLPEGLLPPQTALRGAKVFRGIAFAAIGILGVFIQRSVWVIVLPLVGLVLAWDYSAPPLRLHSRGAGELTVALIVPVLTPLVGYTFQTGVPGILPLLAAVPLAFLQVGMVLSVNLPDAAGDRLVEKRTLVLRLGPEGAARLYLACLALAYLSLPFLAVLGLPPQVAAAALLPVLLAAWLAYRMARGDWAEPGAWNSLAFWSVGLLVASAVLEAAAFLGWSPLSLIAQAG